MNILEHAYKSYGKPIPWQFYAVRDSRTVFSLWPDLPKPVLAYCRSGTRSITLWALSQRNSVDREVLVAAARNAGYDLSQVL